MKPITVRLSAAGFSSWIPLDQYSQSFAIGLGIKLSSGASLTYDVEHTFDDIWGPVTNWSATRSTTTATVTMVNHGLSVGDYIKVFGSAAPFDGAYAVAGVTDADTFTYTVVDSGATSVALGQASMVKARIFNHDTLASQTASADGNYAFPPRAVRLAITTYSSGFADLTVISAGKS